MGKIKPRIGKTLGSAVNHYSDETLDGRDLDSAPDTLLNKSPLKGEGTSGASVGTIRIIVDGDLPYIEIMSSSGWVRSNSTSASGFLFKK